MNERELNDDELSSLAWGLMDDCPDQKRGDSQQ